MAGLPGCSTGVAFHTSAAFDGDCRALTLIILPKLLCTSCALPPPTIASAPAAAFFRDPNATDAFLPFELLPCCFFVCHCCCARDITFGVSALRDGDPGGEQEIEPLPNRAEACSAMCASPLLRSRSLNPLLRPAKGDAAPFMGHRVLTCNGHKGPLENRFQPNIATLLLAMDGEEDQEEEPVVAPVEEEEEVPEPVRAVAKYFAGLSHSPHSQHLPCPP